jgi:hypothetical protein
MPEAFVTRTALTPEFVARTIAFWIGAVPSFTVIVTDLAPVGAPNRVPCSAGSSTTYVPSVSEGKYRIPPSRIAVAPFLTATFQYPVIASVTTKLKYPFDKAVTASPAPLPAVPEDGAYRNAVSPEVPAYSWDWKITVLLAI